MEFIGKERKLLIKALRHLRETGLQVDMSVNGLIEKIQEEELGRASLEDQATRLWLAGKTWGFIMETLNTSDDILEELIGWRCN